MKIYSKSFYGTHHSWAYVMRSIMMELNKNNFISIDSINGYKDCPNELLDQKGIYIPKPDLEVCYTMPRNFSTRFKKRSKIKAAIYNYESDPMPKEWRNSINYIDYVLPSSNFSKEIFVNSGWDESKCKVLPLGYDPSTITNNRLEKIDGLNTFNFLAVAIPHKRKNLDILIDAYYNAFQENQEVCLILKTQIKQPKHYFEINILNLLQEKQKNRDPQKTPKIYILNDFLPNLSPLYNSAHCLVNCSSAEGFGLPMLEALAHKKINIAPNKGGHVDFLNNNNAILFDSKMDTIPKDHQYWHPQEGGRGIVFNKDDLSQKMLFVYNNYEKLTNNLDFNVDSKFTWESIASQLLCLS